MRAAQKTKSVWIERLAIEGTGNLIIAATDPEYVAFYEKKGTDWVEYVPATKNELHDLPSASVEPDADGLVAFEAYLTISHADVDKFAAAFQAFLESVKYDGGSWKYLSTKEWAEEEASK